MAEDPLSRLPRPVKREVRTLVILLRILSVLVAMAILARVVPFVWRIVVRLFGALLRV
jgi:hypothetical protein